MIRIGFIGVPGSGKTSTARALAANCRRIEHLQNVELATEYARRYIHKYGAITEVWEQYRILNKQLDWEDSIGSIDMLITDSPIFMCLMYAQALSKGTKKDNMVVNDIFSTLTKLNNPLPRYDIIFHVPPIIKPVADGVRGKEQFDPAWREATDLHLRAITKMFKPGIEHEIVSVDIQDRVEECLSIITSLSAPIVTPLTEEALVVDESMGEVKEVLDRLGVDYEQA